MVLNFEPDTDVFYSNKLTLEKLVKLTKDYNLKQEKSVELLKKYRFKNEELIHLEENLYDIKSTMFEQTVDNIHLFLAKNQYSEIENIAKNIHSLVKNEGLRYRDISVITKNIDTYSNTYTNINKR